MQIFESAHCFSYPWHQVSAAHWRKYPNESARHVVAVDTLSRKVIRPGVLRTERLITCRQNAPSWVLKLIGAGGCSDSYVREISEVDLNKQELTLWSSNLTFSRFLRVQETVKYLPHPEFKDQKTLFVQDAEINADFTIKKISSAIEQWTVERFGQNAKTGKEGFEAVLDRLTLHTCDAAAAAANSVANNVMNESALRNL